MAERRLQFHPPTSVESYPFAHRLRTRFAETDAMGIVHHGAYLTYLEAARVEYLRALGYPYERVRDEGIDFSVIEVAVRYQVPLRFDEEVDVAVRVASAKGATFQMEYLLLVAGEVRADAATVHAAVTHGGARRGHRRGSDRSWPRGLPAEAQPGTGASTRQPLWPPKPNEFDSTTPGSHSRASPATTSRLISGSGCSKCAVGGAAGGACLDRGDGLDCAAAPRPWPVTPLVEVTAGPMPPKTLLMALDSARSLSGVEVPWALMWRTSSVVRPASIRASSMHETAPEPSGAGP